MKKKNLINIIIIIILLIILYIFFQIKMAKNINIGNNTNSQEIVNYILNISSYEAKITVEIESNKNKNQYIIKQKYQKPDISTQEIIEPSNIEGVIISKNENQLKLENTKLSLSSIFENYKYVSDNNLDLNCFIEDYKNDNQASWKEENDYIVMMTKNNKIEKRLWINRMNKKPEKLEIKWTNKKDMIYILYNEVDINA